MELDKGWYSLDTRYCNVTSNWMGTLGTQCKNKEPPRALGLGMRLGKRILKR